MRISKQAQAWFAAFTAALLALTSSSSANAQAWSPAPSDQNLKGINLVDSFFNTGESASRLVSLEDSQTLGSMPSERLCKSIDETSYCNFSAGSKYHLSGILLLGVCTSKTEMNCIEKVSINKVGEDETPATFLGMSEGPSFAADAKHGLTSGSSSSLWSSSTKNAGQSSNYSVLAKLNVGYNTATDRVNYSGLNVSVFPYTQVSGSNYIEPGLIQGTDPTGRPQVSFSGGESRCAWTSAGKCGVLEDFSPSTRVSVSLHLSSEVSGWFSGRLKAPNISISKIDASSNLVSISGSSVMVPRLSAGVPKSVPVPTLDERNSRSPGWSGGMMNSLASDPFAFAFVDDFRPILKDTSSGVNDVWSINTIQTAGNNCLRDSNRLMGIVTTNAMVYAGESPQFLNGALQYKVAGMHFMPDGTTAVEGVYDLLIRSDTARCLYGFTSAPISASINVTSSNGEAKTAVTNFREDAGWVHFSAYGFGFSQPIINVKMTQTKVIAKPTTITCVSTKNSKLTKKVTAGSPKCPTGFKKKP